MIQAAKKNAKKVKKDKEEFVGFAMDGRYQLAGGVMHINGTFEMERIQPVINSILEYNLMPAELRPSMLFLHINSEGGRLDQCFSLIDMMNMSQIPIQTVGTGMLASAGLMTFMAGHDRIVSSTCRIMSHVYSGGSVGTHHSLKNMSQEHDRVYETQVQLYERFTGLDRDVIEEELLGRHDAWLTAQEAVDYGIADEARDFYISDRIPQLGDYDDDYTEPKEVSIEEYLNNYVTEDQLKELRDSLKREIRKREGKGTKRSPRSSKG